MKTFRLDFTQDNPCLDGCYVGRIGEHNATELIITPPASMTENENVTNYVIAFVTGGMLIHSEPFAKAATLSVPLWRQLMMQSTLGVQLEAYDSKGEYIAKSPFINSLRLLPSADGESVESDISNPDIVSAVVLNTEARHAHSNKEMLDELKAMGTQEVISAIKGTQPDNNAFVGGLALLRLCQSISNRYLTKRAFEDAIESGELGGSTERPTATYEYDFINDGRMMTSTTSDNTFQIGFFVEDDMTEFFKVDETTEVAETELIGKEIADIEFELTSGEWISIKNMYAVDNIPYISLMNKIERNQVADAEVNILFVAVHYPSNRGFLADGALNKMRVTYYTD